MRNAAHFEICVKHGKCCGRALIIKYLVSKVTSWKPLEPILAEIFAGTQPSDTTQAGDAPGHTARGS